MVPREIQRRVLDAFQPAQCVVGKRVRPSLEWLRAAREAINSVRGAA
jgi:hypothetical protein